MAESRWNLAILWAKAPAAGFLPISRFAHAVQLPPDEGTLFDALAVDQVYCVLDASEYVIHLVLPGNEVNHINPSGAATLGGTVGDGVYLAGSQPAPAYTASRGRPHEWAAPETTLHKEIFRHLRVREAPALAVHEFGVGFDHEEWSIAWYVDAQTVTYTIRLQGSIARGLGSRAVLSEENATVAKQLADMASHFVAHTAQ